MAEARIDKWMWAVRIFKTRTIAAEACKKGRVTINGALVKAARMVKPGDVIQVKKPPITYSFKVLQAIEKRIGAYSKVGNDIPVFVTNSTSHIGAGGEIQANDAAPFKDMEPEMTHAMEFGTEWRFFQHRLGINLTYYRTNT